MPLQLTAAGLEVKDSAEIRADLVDRFKTKLGAGIRTEPGSVIGDIIDIVTLQLVSLNEGLLEIDAAFDRRFAEGASLDELGLLTGVPRIPAKRSTALGEVTGTNGVIIPALSRVRIPNGSTWRTTEAVTIGVGPTPATFEAEELGPVSAATGEITEIVDTVVGWSTVTNTEDAAAGRFAETDEQYRISMRDGLTGLSSSTDQAIRRGVLFSDDNVLSVTVVSNREDVTVDGIPPHNFRTVVYPDTVDRDKVTLAIFENQPAGIRSFGDESENVTDEQGFEQEIRWSWATEIPMFTEVDITINGLSFPTDGEDQIKNAIVAFGQRLDVGQDVYPAQILCEVLETAGVLSAVVRVEATNPPTNTAPIPLDFDEIATFDLADITVTVV